MFTTQHKPARSGTTTVETAVVLPVFLLLVFAIFEFGHAQMITGVLNTACRNAARIGAVEGTSTSQVEARVKQTLATIVPIEEVEVFVKSAEVFDSDGAAPANGSEIESLSDIEVADAEPRTLFVVRAKVPYNRVAIVPMPFLESVVIDAHAFMRHE